MSAADGPVDAPAPWGIPPEGHRLPGGTHVGRVRLQVSDLERSLDWYTTVLGFRVVGRAGEEARLGAHGANGSWLVELRARPGTEPLAGRQRLGLFHFAILLPDRGSLGRFVRHLAGTGARVGAADHLVSEALYLHDPDGLGVEVYADRPRTEWRHEGRELRMTTDPLDLADVARSGGAEAWDGMPAGTTIGHVHLHVGALPEAEAFYHGTLGLDKVVWSYPGALFLSAGGYHHHLGLNVWARGAPPAGERDARLLDWELVVDGADAPERVVERLAAAGHPVAREAGDAVVPDPWGTRLRIPGCRPVDR